MIRRFVAVALVLSLVGVAVAQPSPGNPPFSEGSHVLRWLLKKQELTPLKDFSDLAQEPKQTLLVVLGDLSVVQQVPGGLRKFVDQGGAVLLASDTPPRINGELRDLTGAGIDNCVVERHEDDELRHKGQADRPFVRANDTNLPDGAPNPFAGLRVATNIPSWLSCNFLLPIGIKRLASFPSGATKVFPNGRQSTPGIPLTFAVGGTRGEGRLIFLADHSVFINEMMIAQDCDNFLFAAKTLEWLSGPDSRSRALLVEDGQIQPSFNVALKAVPPPPPMQVLQELFARRNQVVELAQKALVRKEDRDEIDRGVLSMLGANRAGGMARLRRVALWFVAGGLALFVLYRVGNVNRHQPQLDLPILSQAVAQQEPQATALVLRQQSLTESGNLGVVARDLVRQQLTALTASGPTTQPPQVVAGNFWRRRAARQRLSRLWQIAHGMPRLKVTAKNWHRFVAEVDALARDVADGIVRPAHA